MPTSKANAPARHGRLALMLTLSAVVLGGCGGGSERRLSVRDSGAVSDFGYGGGSGGGYGAAGAPTASQEPYVSAYTSDRYAMAKSLAEAEMRRVGGAARDRAALIAGLAAHALDDDSEAEGLLAPLANNPDQEIAGRAEACLGLIAAERSQHDRAARHLSAAARRLSGDEGARAAMFAGDSLMVLNRQAEARTQYRLASGNATDAELRRSIADRLEIGNFTVQIGVYSQRSNAMRAVADIAPTAALLGLGEPRVVERVEASGKASYVVQVGRFTNRRQGTTAQTRLGSGWLVSVATGE